ncbi:MAG: hypothetical protein QE487_17090 [Fluviicola sp.]|nr:hypothetical protein [Fluviicola sp.]
MKTTLISLIFLIVSNLSFGQKVIYRHKTPGEKFPYEYWFSLQLRDTLVCTLTWHQKANGNIAYHIETSDTNMRESFLEVLPSDNCKTSYLVDIDKNGTSEFERSNLCPTLTFSYYDWNPLTIVIHPDDSIKNQMLYFEPRLNDEVYQINSKMELTETELNEIMQCVKNQLKNKNATLDCNDPKRYYVSFQI